MPSERIERIEKFDAIQEEGGEDGEGKGGVARRKTSIFDAENLGGGASQAFGIHIIVCQGGNFQPPEELGEGRTSRTWSDHDCEVRGSGDDDDAI